MDTIYLSIAGLYIKVVFEPLKIAFFRNRIIRKIKSIYRGFILSHIPTKSDIVIHLTEPYHHFITKKIKGEDYYFSYLFKTQNENTLYTTYDINLHQFSHLVLNTIQKKLGHDSGFLLHSSASNVKNNAFLFTGPSGAGKSTIISLLNSTFPALSDDLSIIKKEGNDFVYYQTPFIEKNEWIKKSKKMYTIGKLFFIRKSKEFKVRKIKSKKIVIYELTKQLRIENRTLNSSVSNLLSFIQNFDEYYVLYFAKDRKKLLNLMKRYLF